MVPIKMYDKNDGNKEAIKCAKNKNSHYCTIINRCMDTRRGREKFNNLQILLDSGCSYTIIR